MLGFPILYCKGMRILMFQLSGFYYSSEMLEFLGCMSSLFGTFGRTCAIDLHVSLSHEDTHRVESLCADPEP